MEFARNKRAYFDYNILERLEAGVELKGFEVKAIKSGRMNLGGSYVVAKDGEAYLLNADIPPYQPLNTPDGYDSKRSRRLLLKKGEVKNLLSKSESSGLTLVPLRVYVNHSLIKVEIGLAKSRKAKDKRDLLKKRAALREVREA
ncbi:MAG: SsrA-binding protein SmpB [Candidatus Colwellbacteria bacterium]|nr:SsrA-binding protein SmpB [Candidatus Colwellbacteria bacterium]